MGFIENMIGWTTETFAPLGAVGMFLLAFVEAFIFPVPPDLLLIVLCLAKPSFSMFYATIATAGSVIGGFLGYYIGYKIGRPFLEMFVNKRKIEKAHRMVQDYDALAIFLGGFTPIPYKVMTITGGIVKMKLTTFFMASFFSRGPRFFIVAGLIMFYGKPIVDFISDYFNIISVIVAIIIVVAFIAWKLYPRRQS